MQKTTNVQRTTFVQTFLPQMCKSVKIHQTTNVQTSRLQMCKRSILMRNVQTTSHKFMCKSLFSSRISLLQPNKVQTMTKLVLSQHMPGHIYGTVFLKTSRTVNHLSHLRIT